MSPSPAIFILLDINSSICLNHSILASNSQDLNNTTLSSNVKEKELEFREHQLRLAQQEHNYRQQILEHSIRLYELQLAAQRAQHELELRQQTAAAIDSISQQCSNLHQEVNTALDTVYNEKIASCKVLKSFLNSVIFDILK